ncbi:MAG: glycosyltransferase, partial [Lachnospiraceae bacterium]|nr:glycosyltransferase [Lachnospiraceae bacterium]
MSNVLLENAASGRPVITTDNPGCRETCADGVSGFIYPKGNREALILAVQRFLELPNEKRREMGLMGRKRMERHFSREIVIRAYLKEIKRLTK